jgi:predicted outer membrane repeat protein
MRRRTTVGAGISLGALMALPATAQADDLKVKNLNNSGTGSLREAVDAANAEPDADRILFKSKLSGTIELTSIAALLLDTDVEIRGPGARQLTVTREGVGGSILLPEDAADVKISGLTLANNTSAYNGGAIAAYDADLTLSRVTISGNSATGETEPAANGGGVSQIGGSLRIENSTITGNSAEGPGGGEYGGGVYTAATAVTIINSTVSGNTVGEDGGGVYFTDGSDALLRHVTITNNDAPDDGGGLYSVSGELEVFGAIVSGNTAPGEDDDLYVHDPDFSFTFSLIGDPDDTGLTSAGGNIIGADPRLKPLKNNGGPTDTHAFKKSPAKNKVPKNQSENRDQRGVKRKGKGDIGAYELFKCEGVIVNRVGTSKNDKLKGTKKKDGILGLGGNDKLSGKKGKDGLCGGKGKDKLKGGPGKDKLDGGPGKDKEIQ